jgi:CheY-like chemotaxis protein
MAGELILIVDDTPVNLKLTRILLVNEGYKVKTAASAEEALQLLREIHPDLILTDIQLPGMDGFELTRRLKAADATRDIQVVALTAFAMKGDQDKAAEVGCDGYITKPIDTRTLGLKIREIMSRRVPAAAAPPTAVNREAIPAAELDTLRRRFLDEGLEQSRKFLADLDGRFDADAAARAVHQWIGAGGLLGYGAISRLSREVEAVLNERPVDSGQLRESVTNLVLAFTNPKEAKELRVPDSIFQSLSGKRVGLIGFSANERERLRWALERAQGKEVLFDSSELPSAEALDGCDLVVAHAGWLAENSGSAGKIRRPLVIAGNRDAVLALDGAVQSLVREYLVDPWEPDEALLRLSFAITERPASARAVATAGGDSRQTAGGRPRVLIADDDPTVLALVRASFQNFGIDCQTAGDGLAAVEAIRRDPPRAAVLDVNMPGLDGYEVLEKIRAEKLPVRILLLTARQREQDILRGFRLGADDYLVKPFNPVELVARLKRLLW